MAELRLLGQVHTKPDMFETALQIRVDRLVKAVYGQVARKSSRPKLCRRKCSAHLLMFITLNNTRTFI